MRKMLKKLICVFATGCILFGSILPVMAKEPFEIIGDVTPSKTDYNVTLTGAGGFLSNKTPVTMTEGKYYFLTYTVDTVKTELWQNGVMATSDNVAPAPYTKGTMRYTFSNDILFQEGCTYFFRFEMTKEGLSYVIAKADKEGKLSYIDLNLTEGQQYEGCQYFGIWLGAYTGRIDAELSRVLCYDAQGNDLGISVNAEVGGGTVMNYDWYQEKDVPHSYEFSLDNMTDVAISNARGTDAETVFMSYTVKNVQKNICTKAGGCLSNSPQLPSPHAEGILNYTFLPEGEESPLLHEGSSYLVRFERNNGQLKVLVKETNKSNAVSYFGFTAYYGEYRPNSEYFSLWFGDGTSYVTADFVNFKCYDDKGKNLAVQVNNTNVAIRHIGNLEDYSPCVGVYYSIEKDTFLILDDECNIGRRVDEEGQDTVWGTYTVNEDKLTMKIDGTVEEFRYLYNFMKDNDDHKYIRLREQKVKFVAGDADHEGNKTTVVTAEDGYKVAEPEQPVIEGYTFEGWCLGDGTEYDFTDVVTETITLYAKYSDGNGHEYLTVEKLQEPMPLHTIVITAGTITLVAATILICILIVKKGRKQNVEFK